MKTANNLTKVKALQKELCLSTCKGKKQQFSAKLSKRLLRGLPSAGSSQ
jgi:hypothetical protein